MPTRTLIIICLGIAIVLGGLSFVTRVSSLNSGPGPSISRQGNDIGIEIGVDITPDFADDLHRQLAEIAPQIYENQCIVRVVDANTSLVSTSVPSEPAEAYKLFKGISTRVRSGTNLALYFEWLANQRPTNERLDAILLASDLLDDGNQASTRERILKAVRILLERNPRLRLVVLGLVLDARSGVALGDLLMQEFGTQRMCAISREALGEGTPEQVASFINSARPE